MSLPHILKRANHSQHCCISFQIFSFGGVSWGLLNTSNLRTETRRHRCGARSYRNAGPHPAKAAGRAESVPGLWVGSKGPRLSRKGEGRDGSPPTSISSLPRCRSYSGTALAHCLPNNKCYIIRV